MPFSRIEIRQLDDVELDAALRSIGIRIGRAAFPSEPSDIETTLVSAVLVALPRDYRLLGALVAWLEIHHPYVNVPKLARAVNRSQEPLVRAWWATIGYWLGRGDTRWRAHVRLYHGGKLDLDNTDVTNLQLQRVGSDPRFEDGPLRIHAKLLRSRTADVDTPITLASRHPFYLKRVELGPSYRADVWAALDAHPNATAADVARRVGCSYETARSVSEDWRIVRNASELAETRADRRPSGHLP